MVRSFQYFVTASDRSTCLFKACPYPAGTHGFCPVVKNPGHELASPIRLVVCPPVRWPSETNLLTSQKGPISCSSAAWASVALHSRSCRFGPRSVIRSRRVLHIGDGGQPNAQRHARLRSWLRSSKSSRTASRGFIRRRNRWALFRTGDADHRRVDPFCINSGRALLIHEGWPR